MIGVLDALSVDEARGVVQTIKAAFGQGPGAEALAVLRTHFSARTSMNKDPYQMAFLEGQRYVLLTIDHLMSFDERQLQPAPVDAVTNEGETYA